ncbi:MAG: DUF4280 domain-containing protein [Desulfobacterales bacterium]|nr:DUF4280 domain-containing protein [Desulfobacterales bacterium]
MANLVVTGATLSCSMGTAPTALVVTSNTTVTATTTAATIMDYASITNIPTFAMCASTSNPTTIAATAAASGVYTQGACIPACAAPWSPGASKTTIGGIAALLDSDTCSCSYGGSISITYAGQVTVSAS